MRFSCRSVRRWVILPLRWSVSFRLLRATDAAVFYLSNMNIRAFERILLVTIPLIANTTGPGASASDRLFRGPRPFPLPAPSSAIITEDFNGDGRPDFALTHESTAQVSVVLGHQEMVLAPADTYSTGLSPIAIVSGDLDGSGLSDLVVVNSGSSSGTILLNRGDGIFDAAREVAFGLSPRAAVLADFNGDGFLDLATSNLQSKNFNALLGDGRGGFGKSFVVHVGDNPHSLAAADFDADGRSDLAVVHADVHASVSLFPGRGDGSFDGGIRTVLDEASTSRPRLVDCGDFDEDGLQDLAVLTDRVELLFLRNTGAREFEPRLVSAQAGIPANAVFAAPFLLAIDFDADGHLDVLSKTLISGRFALRVHVGDGAGQFDSPRDVSIDPGLGLGALAFADVNRDGVLDVAATRSSADLAIVHGLVPGRLDVSTTLVLEDARPVGVVSFDVDENGDQDLIALSPRALHVSLRKRGEFLAWETHPLAGFAQELIRGDFDGDLRPEVAWPDVTKGSVAVVVFSDDGRIERMVEHTVGDLPSELVSADLNGDGRSELVVGDLAETMLRVIRRPVDDAATILQVEIGGRPSAIEATRVNGDATADLLVATDERLLVFLGDGVEELRLERSFDDMNGIQSIAAADLDADGSSDLVAAIDSRLEIIYAFLLDQNPRRETRDLGVKIDALEIHDLQQDGAPELGALLSSGSGSIRILGGFRPGAEIIDESYLAGADPRAFLFHDVNGDGSIDCTIADSSSRSLTIVSGASRGDASFRRGDAEVNGRVNLTDATLILKLLFQGERPLACEDAADTNDDGRINITDAIGLLTHLFGGGPAPPAPGPAACGDDPTEDLLECTSGCR